MFNRSFFQNGSVNFAALLLFHPVPHLQWIGSSVAHLYV